MRQCPGLPGCRRTHAGGYRIAQALARDDEVDVRQKEIALEQTVRVDPRFVNCADPPPGLVARRLEIRREAFVYPPWNHDPQGQKPRICGELVDNLVADTRNVGIQSVNFEQGAVDLDLPERLTVALLFQARTGLSG